MSSMPQLGLNIESFSDGKEAVLRKVAWRLLPFLFGLYILAYLDRVNVGFAAAALKSDLDLSDEAYGFGAGIFFFGYALFEVPSNLILARVGARRWIARIMIIWGILSASMLFVRGAQSFYALRFGLGIAEAGFFPGILLYLTYWFPESWRARAVARFMTATALAGVIGAPVSSAALALDGTSSLTGWQWLFLVEGIPSILVGMVVFFYLTDRPEHARWLTPQERDWLATRLRQDQDRQKHQKHTFAEAVRSGRVWLLASLYFLLVTGMYGISFWLPETLRGLSGWTETQSGLASAVPFLSAAIGMILIGSHSDRYKERRWHLALSAFLGAGGLVICTLTRSALPALAALAIASVGIWGALGPFWALPTQTLRGQAAAGGIALINSLGNLGGFLGPYLIGWLNKFTGNSRSGLLFLAASLAAGGLLGLWVAKLPGVQQDDGNGKI
jgi:MFS transporter, ACS family, tartrate transporter